MPFQDNRKGILVHENIFHLSLRTPKARETPHEALIIAFHFSSVAMHTQWDNCGHVQLAVIKDWMQAPRIHFFYMFPKLPSRHCVQMAQNNGIENRVALHFGQAVQEFVGKEDVNLNRGNRLGGRRRFPI